MQESGRWKYFSLYGWLCFLSKFPLVLTLMYWSLATLLNLTEHDLLIVLWIPCQPLVLLFVSLLVAQAYIFCYASRGKNFLMYVYLFCSLLEVSLGSLARSYINHIDDSCCCFVGARHKDWGEIFFFFSFFVF